MMQLAKPLAPGSTIGILGGGQLGRMLALAAARLGLNSHIYAPELDSPAFQVCTARTVAGYHDFAALERFANSVDVVTYEFENVPGDTAAFLEGRCVLAPNSTALKTAQDRIDEKNFIAKLNIPVAPFAAVNSEADLTSAIKKIGRPSVLKTRRFGYDGKGQTKIQTDTSPAVAWADIGKSPAILEGFVSFDAEISVIAARGWDGTVMVYDVPENHHENHILKTSTVPARISGETIAAARVMARKIISALDYVGVMGIEMFVAGKKLIVNEIAPRVHNSGHWTQDACVVSQFEQHIRAISGWPLGDTKRHSNVVMHNILGDEASKWAEYAGQAQTGVHYYGKSEPRRGRKMGHINVLTPRQG
jgi:5-(carboxyamino)imidazole ribonucleotide synthase